MPEEVWVELPEAAAEAPVKPRTPRRRARGGDAAITVVSPSVEAVEATPKPVSEAPATVVLAVDNASATKEIDPAEIVAPAVAPRRGWWRGTV
jgi:hypothetical protein